MGFTSMDKVYPDSGNDRYKYEKEVTLAAAGVSDWIKVPAEAGKPVVTFSSDGAEGLVQTCSDIKDTIEGGTPIPVDWDTGAVTTTKGEVFEPVAAIRLKQNDAGATKLTISCPVNFN